MPNNELYTGINSSNYLCTNTTAINDDFYCYIDEDASNINYCSGGCSNIELTNPYGINYIKGFCYNSTTCTNDCNVEGLTYSDTPISYKQCGFYDSDNCLDWSNSIPCVDGEYSTNGFCNTLNTTGFTYYNLRTFTMTPDTTNSVSLTGTSNPPQINLESNQAFINEGFEYNSVRTSFYINQNCNYNETTILENNVKRINTSNDSFNGFTQGIITLNIDIPIDTQLEIIGTDSVDKSLFNFTIKNNASNGVCLLNNESELLGCEFVTLGTNENIDFSIQTMKSGTKYLFTTKTDLNGIQRIFTGWRSQNNNEASTLYKIKTIGENTSINKVKVINGEQNQNTWKNTSAGFKTPYQNTCQISSVGCRTVRSYYSDNLDENQFWNYKEWRVCTNKLSGTTYTETGNNGLLSGMSPITKIVMSFVISFIVMMILIVIGITQNDDSTKRIMIFIGCFLFIGGLILFTLIGWLPFWILIVCGVVASAIVGLFFIKSNTGA